MDKRKIIDKIIYSYKYDEIDVLWEMAEMEATYSEKNLEKYVDEFTRRIATIIEENDFEYFFTRKIEADKDLDVFLLILMHSSKTEKIKEFLKDIKNTSIKYSDIVELILATKDPEYIRNAIEKYQDFGIDYNSATILIRRTKDVELAKRHLERAEEQLESQSQESTSLFEDDWSLDLDISQNYISGQSIVNLLVTVNDKNIILKYLEELEKYSFTEDNITSLINKIKDPEITAQYLENYKADFSRYNIIKMIKAIGEKTFISRYIGDSELQFSIEEKIDLLSVVSDNEWVEDYMRDSKSGFTSEDILQFLKSTDNIALVKQYMAKRDLYGFTQEQIFGLIQAINDKKLTLDCMSNCENYGLSNEDANKLRIIYDTNYRNETLQDNRILGKINLPPEMTIGVEIECVGKMCPFLQAEGKKILDGWKVKQDNSVKSERENESGIEIVSPILTGENEMTAQSVEKVATILNKIGHYSNETCGGHIHIGANYLTSVEAWQNLVELYANTEMILYVISNQEGNVPRKDVGRYAMPISSDLEEAMKNGSVNLETEGDIETFKKNLVSFQNDRYKGINFFNLKSGGRNTIEFRLANGTVDPKMWTENINLFGGIVRVAQELAVIQQKNPEDRTQNEDKMLACFEQIRSGSFDEKQKLEDLLEMVIQERDRDSYRKRYFRNIELLEEKPEIGETIRQKTENAGVRISKKEIVKEVFFSDESVTMSELKEISGIINRNRNHQLGITERGE